MKEIDECQCPTSGYCEFFRQEMTYDPPNWQWCQAASKEERDKYKINCDKKHDRKKLVLDGKYVTNQQLIKDCVDFLIPKIARLNVKGIAAVPRSGFLPASFCSVMLNLPLFLIHEDGLVKPMSALSEFGGKRMENHKEIDGKISIIEINSETDFVAKNEDFINFCKELSEKNFDVKGDIKKLDDSIMKNGSSVKDNWRPSWKVHADRPVC